MLKVNKHIEIVRSTIPSLSSMGRKSCDMIRSVLEQYYEQVGVSIINNTHDLEKLQYSQPDLVFIGVKYVPAITSSAQDSDTKIWVSAFLDEHDINYIGSDSRAIALDFNKPAAKQVILAAGINTSEYFSAAPGQYRNAIEMPLDYPLFIKPPNAGGGKGIGADSVVRNFAAYEGKVLSIDAIFQEPALVEEYLPGREFSVSILANIDSEELIAMPIELITDLNEQGDRVLGQQIKNADTEQAIPVHDTYLFKTIKDLAIDAFLALGARDYGRIDIRLDAQGVPHFLEANLIPGLAFHDFTSYFTTACWMNQRMDYKTMILYLVQLGLSHNRYASNSLLEQRPIHNNFLLPTHVKFEFI